MGKVRRRGSPIYVRSAGRVISLVEEIEEQEIRLKMSPIVLHRVSPSALYVIDEGGVRSLRFKSGMLWLVTFAVGLLPGPLQFYLLARRKKHSGRR